MTADRTLAENSRDARRRNVTPTVCTWCGLPMAGDTGSDTPEAIPSRPMSLGAAAEPAADTVYCCYGCRFAHAVVRERGAAGVMHWTVIRLGLAVFFTMNLMAFTMTMWSLDVYDVEPDAFQQKLYEVFRWLSMVLGLPVLLLLGLPLVHNAAEHWKRRNYSTDLLVGVAVFAAYGLSVVNVVRGIGTIYFEVGAMVLVMMTLGRWIEASGRHRATTALDALLTLLPESAQRLASESVPSAGESVPCEELRTGDVLRIRAGERFPTDGIIARGATTVDEQVFTGESCPVQRTVGDAVLAGTVNLDGDVDMTTTAAFREGSFGRLLQTLQQARLTRGHYQRMADQAANWFFPVVSGIAIVTFAVHAASDLGLAVQSALSVLLISCPCALGLATPLAVWTALSVAVRHQVMFRHGEAIERLADTKAVCFDKTGTLTTGSPRVARLVELDSAEMSERGRFLHRIARSSTHPFSQAIVKYLTDSPHTFEGAVADTELSSIRTVAGSGIEAATSDGSLLRLGSPIFACSPVPHAETSRRPLAGATTSDTIGPTGRGSVMAVASAEDILNEAFTAQYRLDELHAEADRCGSSVVVFARDGLPLCGFLVAESFRDEAAATLQTLYDDGMSLHVLSGDRPEKAAMIREQLAVPEMEIRCGLLPQDKVTEVRAIRERCGTTAMVGDGINDAPALAASDTGIALGCGADVSRDSADVCLLGNDLSRIPWAIELARRTRSVIRRNLFWAFGYNALGVAVAASGWLNPAVAAALMILSSLFVISNSLRLLQHDHDPGTMMAAVETSP